ncbi:hypothetical protein [Apilactobacillus xinyiensis]|uniref:hypothetical protein n=1 Tax=Apilactobacillus xinyiensis TaxID=2841032 RepID=UPI0033650085
MQKSLKKSLYLGLAALSFASVAGATNANAAKKHHSKKTVKTVKKAKPVTYTSSYNLDQSVVYSLNGNNAIYTKPGTVKGARVVASKSDVKSVANSSRGYFMAYGEAKTSKGVHYYKVVSFDHKYRGWVYAGSAKKVDSTTTATDTPKNNVVYLKNNVSNTLWDAPKYSAFKTTKAANNNAAIANDQYKVDKAVKLNREGWTYYHVTNQANPNYTGWVWAGATADAKPTDNFNAAKDIKVNFVYNGSTVKSAVFHAYDMGLRTNNSNVFDQDGLNAKLFTPTTLSQYNNQNTPWLNSVLTKSGYKVADKNAKGFDTNTHNYAALKDVKFGDTVYLSVVKDDDATGKLSAYALNKNQYAVGATRLTSNDVAFPSSLNKETVAYFNQSGNNSQWNGLTDNVKLPSRNGGVGVLVSKNSVTYNDLGATKSVYKNFDAAVKAYNAASTNSLDIPKSQQVNPDVSKATNVAQTKSTNYTDNSGKYLFTLTTNKDNKVVSSTALYDVNNKKPSDINPNDLQTVSDYLASLGYFASDFKDGQGNVQHPQNVKAADSKSTTTYNFNDANGKYVLTVNVDGNNNVLSATNAAGKAVTNGLGQNVANFLQANGFNNTAVGYDQFAGLKSGNKPFGVFDTSSNNTDSDYMKTAVGNNSEQYHMVYFLAPSQTNMEMGNKKMSDGVSFYYYAVPVAGPVPTSSDSLDYLAK